MLTAVILTGDSKFADQLQLWLRQVAPDKMRTESYSTLAAYKKMIAQEAQGPVVGVVEDNANQTPKKIALFIIDVDLIDSKASQWIEALQQVTRETAATLVEARVPKVLVMAYEGGTQRPEFFQTELVDDLILKPIDKTLIQQKVEFLIADSPKLSPSFLFRAKTEQVVEVGHEISIDEVSEFAVAVRSAEPFEEGTFAAIHARVFGSKSARRILGRVYENVKHPVREGEHLVRFSYFGLSSDQLSTVRQFIRSNQTPVRPRALNSSSQNRSARTTGPGSRMATVARGGVASGVREKMMFRKSQKIAVIDMNADNLTEARSILEASFNNSVVKSFPSFARLSAEIHKLGSGVEKGETEETSISDPTAILPALTQAALALIFRGSTYEFVRYEPALKKTETFLGVPAFDWLERPDRFVNTVVPEDREAFFEFLQCVESGAPGKVFFRIPNSGGRLIYFEATGQLEKTGEVDGISLIRVDLSELEAEEWKKLFKSSHSGGGIVSGEKDPAAFRFDAVLIDSVFLRSNASEWCTNFVESLRTNGVLGPEDPPPKIFIMSDPKTRANPGDFRVEGIVDFVYKPLDRRLVTQKFQAYMPELLLTREPEAAAWIPTEIPAMLGRETIMAELAEYGLVIEYPQPFERGVFMRFFSALFGDETWILGRCHSSEKIEKTGGCRSQFVFFGHSDELLQKIRRWIREDYVAQKDTNP